MAQLSRHLFLAVSILASVAKIATQSTASPTYLPLPEDWTRESIAVIIDVNPDQDPSILCWYPISGNYCTLPRILFYLTIVAAILLRHNAWLRVGALAASLTYSGSAAIHACLLIWSGRAFGELDVVPLIAILSTSCLVMVPLLTWSSTIRYAGKPLEEKLHQEKKLDRLLRRLDEQTLRRIPDEEQAKIFESFHRRRKRLEQRKGRGEDGSVGLHVASRTILLFWGCLVVTGFGCVFAAVIDQTPDSRYGHFTFWDQSQATEIRCTPKNGTLDVMAGQNLGVHHWEEFIITSEFLDANNCLDPCPKFPGRNGPIPFRVDSDFQSLTENEWFMMIAGGGFTIHAREWAFMEAYVYELAWLGVYLIAQGVGVACFGRSQPSQTRIRTYGFIAHLRLRRTAGKLKPGKWQSRFAKGIALVTYFGAVGIAIITVPLLVMNVIVVELYISQLPQSESPTHIGAWGSYASTGLALLSFFIAYGHISNLLVEKLHSIRRSRGSLLYRRVERYQPVVERDVYKGSLRGVWFKLHTNSIDYFLEQRNSFLDALHYEWTYTRSFWRDPDDELAKYKEQMEEVDKFARRASGSYLRARSH